MIRYSIVSIKWHWSIGSSHIASNISLAFPSLHCYSVLSPLSTSRSSCRRCKRSAKRDAREYLILELLSRARKKETVGTNKCSVSLRAFPRSAGRVLDLEILWKPAHSRREYNPRIKSNNVSCKLRGCEKCNFCKEKKDDLCRKNIKLQLTHLS